MNKRILLLFVALMSLSAFAQNRAQQLREKFLSRDTSYVFVAAHRADWRNFPENSLEGIESAINMGVDIIELDLHRTADGTLILMHDGKLDRTTTGKGKISEVTMDSISKLRLKAGHNIRTAQKVPTLEEALLLAKGRVLINLDKADRYFDQVYALTEKTGTTDQIIMKGSKSPAKVKELYGPYLDKMIYMPIVHLHKDGAQETVNKFVKQLNPPAFEFLYVSDKETLPLKIKNQLSGKTLIWYNTLWDTMAGGHDDDMSLKDPDAGYGYLIDKLGCTMIQTDRPQYLINYLEKRGLRNFNK